MSWGSSVGLGRRCCGGGAGPSSRQPHLFGGQEQSMVSILRTVLAGCGSCGGHAEFRAPGVGGILDLEHAGNTSVVVLADSSNKRRGSWKLLA